MTTPIATTASTSPEEASRRATTGISNAPGTQDNDTSSSATPCCLSARSAPSTRRFEIVSLKRLATIAILSRRPSSAPSYVCTVDAPLFGFGSPCGPDGLEKMTELLSLRREVTDVLVRRRALEWNSLHDGQAIALESGSLSWVVRQQAHGRNAEIHEDLRTYAVITGIGREAKFDVRLDGVEAPVLQCVGLELVPQTDAAAFVSSDVNHPVSYTHLTLPTIYSV